MNQQEKALQQYFERFPEEKSKLEKQAMRYALANGNLPATKENLAFVGQEYHLSADKLPKSIQEKLLKIAEKHQKEWQYNENISDWTDEEISNELSGVWIQGNEITSLSITVKRKATIEDRHDLMKTIPLEEIFNETTEG